MDQALHVADIFVDSTVQELRAANQQLFRVVDDLKTLIHQRSQAQQGLADSHFETLFVLALGAEFRGGWNGLRLLRIGASAEILARASGMPEDYCLLIRRAAPLYDIGMTTISDELLRKREALSDEEWVIWKGHAEIGARLLSASVDTPLGRLAAEIALSHHEDFQGYGFPAGLVGAAIPLSGRIVALAEYHETHSNPLGQRREPQRPGLTLDFMRDLAGLRFDPVLVELFLAHLPAISAAHREIDGRVGSFQALAAGARPGGELN